MLRTIDYFSNVDCTDQHVRGRKLVETVYYEDVLQYDNLVVDFRSERGVLDELQFDPRKWDVKTSTQNVDLVSITF